MPIYHKSTVELMKDYFQAIDLKDEKTFKRQDLYDWFAKSYGKIKRGTLYQQLVKISVNASSRKHHNPRSDGSDDILFQTGADAFRLYNKETDAKEPTEFLDEEESEQHFVLEKHLQEFLARNLSLIEPGLRLYEDEESGKNGMEYPADGRFIDILALDKDDNFVVIELKVSKGYDRVVGQLLRYKNWIKRYMTDNGQCVRGIIVCKEITDDLSLACDGLKDIELFEYELYVKLSKKAESRF